MNKRAVYDLISVLGAIVPFSAWIFQQTSVEKQNSLIAKLDQAGGKTGNTSQAMRYWTRLSRRRKETSRSCRIFVKI